MKNLTLSILPIIYCAFAVLMWKTTNAKKILILTPVPSYSHHTAYEPIWLALNRRGHDITLLTPYPKRNTNLTNYKEIDFSASIDMTKDLNIVEMQNIIFPELLKGFQELMLKLLDNMFNHSEVKQLFANDTKSNFDVVLMELFFPAAAGLLAHKFNAPLIGVISGYVGNDLRYIFGSPILPSHPSNWELQTNTGFNLTFWQRLQNFIMTWRSVHHSLSHFFEMQQVIAEKYLGSDIPRVRDVARNISLILMNQNPAFVYARPELPNLIFYTNLHISGKVQPLPKDLKNFLDNANEGFIYMSLGSNVKSKYLPKNILRIFLDVFSELPYKVLWKFENDEISDKPENVFLLKWTPQQSVLAHPNIKLYIYQGGYQSTEEAVHYSVPLIGIPFFSDQYFIVNKMVLLGVAEQINLSNVTREILKKTINRVLNDSSYKENMKDLRALSKDLPFDSLENVVWWIEHVMQHRGATHLRYSVADEPWYQRYDMDVIVFLVIALFLLASMILAVLVQISIFIYKCFYINQRRTKKSKHE